MMDTTNCQNGKAFDQPRDGFIYIQNDELISVLQPFADELEHARGFKVAGHACLWKKEDWPAPFFSALRATRLKQVDLGNAVTLVQPLTLVGIVTAGVIYDANTGEVSE